MAQKTTVGIFQSLSLDRPDGKAKKSEHNDNKNSWNLSVFNFFVK
jgi:hypothetical protein